MLPALPRCLLVTIEPRGDDDTGRYGGGHDVSLNGAVIGVRPYDGSASDEVFDEVVVALAGLLGEKLGWKED